MGRRATDLATPVPVLGVPALVGLRGYKTLAGEKINGPPPLPLLSWTQQCSIGVQTSPGMGKLPLRQPGVKPPVNIIFSPWAKSGTNVLDGFAAKELREEGILQLTQSDRQQGLASRQRCTEAKTRKEVTFQEIPAGTSEQHEASQGNSKAEGCYARAIKTNPHLAGNLTKVGPKPKLCLRYTNGSVVDSEAIGGISVEGGDARPKKEGASLEREHVDPVGGHCAEQTGEGASVSVLQPFRTPPKICNQCGGKQTVICGTDNAARQRPTTGCPEGIPLNQGTIPPPTTNNTTTTTPTDVTKLRDLQVGFPQHPQRMTPCMSQRTSLAGRPPLLSPNAGPLPKAPHPSCPVHSVIAFPQGHPVASLPPQTPTQPPAVLQTKALTVTEAIIETRQNDANSNSLEMQPHSHKHALAGGISSPPQFAIATKSNLPYGCSYRKWTETSNGVTVRHNMSDDGAMHIAPGNTKVPAAVLESTLSHESPLPGPEDAPDAIKTSKLANTRHTDNRIYSYTMGFKNPNAVNNSMTVQNKNIKNQECSDSRSSNPMNLDKPVPKASLEMVMNTKNKAKTAMRTKTFPGSILHLATTQVMDTLSSYKQNNTLLPVGGQMQKDAPTHRTSHTIFIAKTTTDLVAATDPFRRVGAPLETNPPDSMAGKATPPTSNPFGADLVPCLRSRPSSMNHEPQIGPSSNCNAFSPSALCKIIPLAENNSSCPVSPSTSPTLIEKPRSGNQSHVVPLSTSSDGAHLTYAVNLDRPSHVNISCPTQTSPDTQTHPNNGPALENGGPIHQSSPTSTSQGPRGAAVQLTERLTLSEEMHLVGEVPNSSPKCKTNAHLHQFPSDLQRNMMALAVSDHCINNHTYTLDTMQRDTKVNSIIETCFDQSKDNFKSMDIQAKQDSKPHRNSVFLKVTHHLNYISRIKPQRFQSQISMNTNNKQLSQLQGSTDTLNEVQIATPRQVRPSEEIQHPPTSEPGRPACDTLENSAARDKPSLCSTTPTRTPTTLRRCRTPVDLTAESSLEEGSPGKSSRWRISESDTLSSRATCAGSSASSASSVLSQTALDTVEQELYPHTPTGPTCGIKLRRPWTHRTALAQLRSRVRAGYASRLGLRGPGFPAPQAHAHPPDAEEHLLPPSPRCSKASALQGRLDNVEASLEANRARISTLLHIIQDLEQGHAPIGSCWCLQSAQEDPKNCAVCQRTACAVYGVEYDFRQQEKCFVALFGGPPCDPPGHAAPDISPSLQTHNVTGLRDALAKRIARSKVKSKKLCKTFFKLLPRKSQQR